MDWLVLSLAFFSPLRCLRLHLFSFFLQFFSLGNKKLICDFFLAVLPQVPPMRYYQQPGSADATMVHLLVEYLKQQHEADMQFRRDDLEARQREKSEDRRLERDKLDLRKAELAMEQQKWDIEKRERELNLELLKKKLSK